jgi:hypothetical protein
MRIFFVTCNGCHGGGRVREDGHAREERDRDEGLGRALMGGLGLSWLGFGLSRGLHEITHCAPHMRGCAPTLRCTCVGYVPILRHTHTGSYAPVGLHAYGVVYGVMHEGGCRLGHAGVWSSRATGWCARVEPHTCRKMHPLRMKAAGGRTSHLRTYTSCHCGST